MGTWMTFRPMKNDLVLSACSWPLNPFMLKMKMQDRKHDKNQTIRQKLNKPQIENGA